MKFLEKILLVIFFVFIFSFSVLPAYAANNKYLPRALQYYQQVCNDRNENGGGIVTLGCYLFDRINELNISALENKISNLESKVNALNTRVTNLEFALSPTPIPFYCYCDNANYGYNGGQKCNLLPSGTGQFCNYEGENCTNPCTAKP
jgi:hypothetical protein